jgi:hypothetical protein
VVGVVSSNGRVFHFEDIKDCFCKVGEPRRIGGQVSFVVSAKARGLTDLPMAEVGGTRNGLTFGEVRHPLHALVPFKLFKDLLVRFAANTKVPWGLKIERRLKTAPLELELAILSPWIHLHTISR